MSRLSTVPKSRQSIFQSGSEQYTSDANATCPPNLRECVLAMEDCCEEVLHASEIIYALHSQIAFRLTKLNNYYGMELLIYRGWPRC